MAAGLHYIMDTHTGGGLNIYNQYCICTAAGASDCMFSSLHECFILFCTHSVKLGNSLILFSTDDVPSFHLFSSSLLYEAVCECNLINFVFK